MYRLNDKEYQRKFKANSDCNDCNTNTSPTIMEDKNTGQLGSNFEKFSPPLQFALLGSGVFFFFGIHNILQEAMMKIPGFNYGVMLGYMEVIG